MKVGFKASVLLVFTYSTKRFLEVLRQNVVEMYCEILEEALLRISFHLVMCLKFVASANTLI